MIRSLKIAASFVLCFLMVSTNVRGAEFSFDYQKTIKLDRSVKLDLSLIKGQVVIEGTEEDRIVIEVQKIVRATDRHEAEAVADHIEIKVVEEGDVVRISTNYLRMLDHSPTFWQKFLGGSSDSYGSVRYKIKVPAVTSISVNAISAEITLSSIEGEIFVDNSSGSTVGEFLFGSVEIRQPVGRIDLKWIEGDIQIRSYSSRITIQQVRGAIDLSTYAGQVTVQTELDSPKDYIVETATGSIAFLVPFRASGDLSIRSQSGKIKSTVPVTIKSVARNQLEGVFGDGGPKVRLSSTSGDVLLDQY